VAFLLVLGMNRTLPNCHGGSFGPSDTHK